MLTKVDAVGIMVIGSVNCGVALGIISGATFAFTSSAPLSNTSDAIVSSVTLNYDPVTYKCRSWISFSTTLLGLDQGIRRAVGVTGDFDWSVRNLVDCGLLGPL